MRLTERLESATFHVLVNILAVYMHYGRDIDQNMKNHTFQSLSEWHCKFLYIRQVIETPCLAL